MLEYDRIDLSEGIDVNKREEHRKNVIYASIIILCLKILIIKDIYAMDVTIFTKAISMQNIAIIYHDGQAYRVNFAFMSRNDAFNLMKKSVIIDKKGTL